MTDASSRHNTAIRPVLKMIIEQVGLKPTELLVFLESLTIGIFMMVVRLGGDEPVIDVWAENIRLRMAESRLGALDAGPKQ